LKECILDSIKEQFLNVKHVINKITFFWLVLCEPVAACASVSEALSYISIQFLIQQFILSTMFLNACNLCSSLRVRDQVTQEYKITDKIIVLHILNLGALKSIEELCLLG
jgi:hypothetical protein